VTSSPREEGVVAGPSSRQGGDGEAELGDEGSLARSARGRSRQSWIRLQLRRPWRLAEVGRR
jgi:hypothetical protein